MYVYKIQHSSGLPLGGIESLLMKDQKKKKEKKRKEELDGCAQSMWQAVFVHAIFDLFASQHILSILKIFISITF
jgi:hypothetical protein